MCFLDFIFCGKRRPKIPPIKYDILDFQSVDEIIRIDREYERRHKNCPKFKLEDKLNFLKEPTPAIDIPKTFR